MVNYCCAFGCKEAFIRGGPITFHRFPKDEQRRRIWEIKTRRKNFKASDHTCLCSKHFSPDCFDRDKFGGTWLKNTAVPTIFNFPNHLTERVFTRKSYIRKTPKPVMEQAKGNLFCKKDGKKSSDSAEFLDSEIESDEMEENNSALLDFSMNEKFYPPEQLAAAASSVSKRPTSNPKCQDLLEKKDNMRKQLKAKIFLKALKKQWLDAEIKAATAKKDYYETKTVMLSKLQNDLNSENSSGVVTSPALQTIKSHLKKEELASKIEKRMLKQKLAEAKIAADNSEKEYYKAGFGISFSDDT